MLTSKEIIERTGISRATLNNYIASGLVPRPQVLPPGPEHGAAPRIGYFPDDTVERIETIQRLKREGWSIPRIAEHFTAVGAQAGEIATPSAPAAPAERPAVPPPPAATRAPSPAPLAGPVAARQAPPPAAPRLTLADAGHPAYLVNDGFRIVWANEEARVSALSPVAHAGVAGGNVFRHLLDLDEERGPEALLRFHLEAARSRAASPAELFGGLEHADVQRLEAMYEGVPRPAERPLVSQELLPRAAAQPARWIHAVHFHEGVLFALKPHTPEERDIVPGARASEAPTLTPVAVLAAVLQDAAGLWVRLAPEEYFELLNEIGRELDAIFRRYHGRSRRPAGETVVCYFLPQAQGSHLWNALAAAHQAREAMRQVSQRWQVRKGWDVELSLNVGIDEGQDWLGALGLPDAAEVRVLGDAADRAGHLSHCARKGSILITRNVVGKLPRQERQQLTYGAPRPEGTPGEAPLLFTFARLADIAAPDAAPPAVADLAVAELLDLHVPLSPPTSGLR